MNVEDFEAIFEDRDIDPDLLNEPGCNALKGLKIIEKYMPEIGIEAASHDVIYSASVYDIVDAGITEEDAINLVRLNWMIECEYLACFV